MREQLALQKLEISKQQAKTKSVEVGLFLFKIVKSFNLFDRGEYFFQNPPPFESRGEGRHLNGNSHILLYKLWKAIERGWVNALLLIHLRGINLNYS